MPTQRAVSAFARGKGARLLNMAPVVNASPDMGYGGRGGGECGHGTCMHTWEKKKKLNVEIFLQPELLDFLAKHWP